MKPNHLLTGFLVIGSVLTMSAQDVSSSPYLVSGGQDAGHNGDKGTYYGYQAGKQTVAEAIGNCFIGHDAGVGNITGVENVFMGLQSGTNSSEGHQNVFIGSYSAVSSINSNRNVVIGQQAGDKMVSGDSNVYLGIYSGSGGPSKPNNNTFLGAFSGTNSYGSGNVFLGTRAGAGSKVDNQLYISNSDDATPLIWGDFKNDLAKVNGKLGTGNLVNFPTMAGNVNVSKYSIFAMGGILTEEVRIMKNIDWADYVFDADYKLSTLDEVEAFIQQNGHLPNVPSATEIKRDGLELGEIAKIQQEKIEELTLYLIEQKKQNEKQDQQIKELTALVQQLTQKK
ncbi:hypothetical protein ACX0HA_01995 [Flavobacterium hauense]